MLLDEVRVGCRVKFVRMRVMDGREKRECLEHILILAPSRDLCNYRCLSNERLGSKSTFEVVWKEATNLNVIHIFSFVK